MTKVSECVRCVGLRAISVSRNSTVLRGECVHHGVLVERVPPTEAELRAANETKWMELISSANNSTDKAVFVWRLLLSLPLSLRFRMMAALDAANRREAHIVMGFTEHLITSLKEFDAMRIAWRTEIRQTFVVPHVSLVTLFLNSSEHDTFTHTPSFAQLQLALSRTIGENATSLVVPLLTSTAHIDSRFCKFVAIVNSVHSTVTNGTFDHDPSCGHSNDTTIHLDTHPVTDSHGKLALMSTLTRAITNPESFDVDPSLEFQKIANGVGQSGFSSFLEVESTQGEDPGSMFKNIQQEFGIKKGDALGVYQKIMGMQIQPLRQQLAMDASGKVSGFDLHFLEPVRRLLAERDFGDDPKGYVKRQELKNKKKVIRQRLARYGDPNEDWNFSTESEEEQENIPETSAIANRTSDIGESASAAAEMMVMRSVCHQGLGRDLRDALATKVQLHVGTECIDLIAGFISPIVSPILNSALGIFIKMIAKALCDAMADCVTFRLVGLLAPTLDGMLSRMMVPPMTMGIVMILPQALTKVLETKFKVMLGAPLAQAIVKAVLKYRSQVSTPLLYHTISHSLSHSIESVLSASLVHTVTNTAGSALAHSLSHSLPAYYACMRCYHNRMAGILRTSATEQDDCSLCYSGNSLRTQERQAYAVPRVSGYHTMNPIAVPAGLTKSILNSAVQLGTTGTVTDELSFDQRAGHTIATEVS
eukprot:c7871_g1_i1.p1 GENE.c7871_g1_i1~~c7871_g1_i1.p1  ORF type:complete len:764 (-),score=218.57 c7871_g1_i1:30-2144(-)